MKTRTFSSARRAGRSDARTPAPPLTAILLGCLLAGGILGFAPALDAAERYWNGLGLGAPQDWSYDFNWIPVGQPRDGEDLVFGEIFNTDTLDTMVNDLSGLNVQSLTFTAEVELFNEPWILSGNELTVTGDITCEQDVDFNCPITLGQSIVMRVGRTWHLDDPLTIRFNGPLNLGEHTLTIINQGPNPTIYRINSTITGRGNLRFINEDINQVALAVFGGDQANALVGKLTFERRLDLGARPFQASFDQPGGNVVHGGLLIGDGCEVTVRRPDQIGENATVSITGGGRLLLNGHAETIGSLELSNVHADADPTLVDGTGTTLTLRGGITTSVFNEDGHIPTIRGTLVLPGAGTHVFNLNNQLLPGFGLDLQGPIVGPGGIAKLGNATLVLATSNSFDGPVFVNDGILDIQNADALGATTGGLIIGNGTVILRNTLIHGETLFVRGTKPVTANTAGSFLDSTGLSGWFGRIELDTNLVVNSTDLCILGGPIVGRGGLEFLGRNHQIFGGSSNEGSDYFGLTRVLCELLTVNIRPAFHAKVVVGGGFRPRCEVRWGTGSSGGAGGFSDVTVHTNGLINLNGFNDSLARLSFHGGRVSTGSGLLTIGEVITHPTNVAAVIEGNLALGGLPNTLFWVDDGPASPDLTVNAVIADGFGGGRAVGVDKRSAGQMDLHRPNTFSGPTLVREGTLSILDNNALGTTSQGTTVDKGATVAFGTQVDTVLEPFDIAGSGVGGVAGALRTVGDVFINNNLVLSGNAAIRAEGTNSRIQVNNISGIGPLIKLGSGRLVLRGFSNNSYSGDTLVAEGVLDLAKPHGFAAVPGHLIIGTPSVGGVAPFARVEQRANFTIVGSVTVNGGLWDLGGTSEDWSIADLQGRPPLTLNDGGDVNTGTGTFVLPVGGSIVVNPGSQRFGGSTISGRVGLDAGAHRISVARGSAGLLGGAECNISATISETGAPAELEKDGDGTLRLGGTNTYHGMTLVTGGTIQVDGVQPQSAARVAGSGRLKGSGTVGLIEMLGPTATVAPGPVASALVPGSGILTCSNFNFGAVQGGILFVELNGTSPGTGYDQINARGTVRLNGLSLQGSLGFASSLNQQFTIINNDGTDAVQGTFDGIDQGASVFLGGERFTISYTGGTGNDVVLTRQVTPQLVVTTLPATETPNFALDFDGRFNRVHVGTNLFPSINNNFTIELWANPTASRTETAEATAGISDLSGQRHAVFPDQGDLGYGPNHAGAGLSIGTNGISVFEHASNHLPSLLVYSNAIPGWTHVALVYSNRQPRLYVNGTLARIGLPSAKTVVHPSANLGGSIQGLTYGNFQGQLDEVRIWNAALSHGQIQSNLNRGLSGTEPGLVLYYRCDETNGVSIADSAPASPNANGTLLNGVASVLSGALPPAALNGPTVTLNGLATPGGLDASVWFEWGTTTNYGNPTATQTVSAVTRAAGFSQTLAGLAAGQYQFRAVGSNGLHFSYGLNQSFTLLNGAPVLNIEKLAGGQVRLLWPTSAAGFNLQANVDLATSNWLGLALPTSVIGTNNVAEESTAGPQKFYRLFKP